MRTFVAAALVIASTTIAHADVICISDEGEKFTQAGDVIIHTFVGFRSNKLRTNVYECRYPSFDCVWEGPAPLGKQILSLFRDRGLVVLTLVPEDPRPPIIGLYDVQCKDVD